MRAAAADRTQTSSTDSICSAPLPGSCRGPDTSGWAGVRRGLCSLIALTLMFVFGLWLEGRLFPFDMTQPLVALAAIADLGDRLSVLRRQADGVGRGDVVAITYEYGNTFIIAAGLLNMLVVLDVFDIAKGRK